MSIRIGGAHGQTRTVKRRAYFATQAGAMEGMFAVCTARYCRLDAASTGALVTGGWRVVWYETLTS